MPDIEQGIFDPGTSATGATQAADMAAEARDMQPQDHGNGIPMSEANLLTAQSADTGSPTIGHNTGLSYDAVYNAFTNLPIYRTNNKGYLPEKMIDSSHYRNVAYLRSKIVKNSLIFDAAREGICEGQFRSCKRHEIFTVKSQAYISVANTSRLDELRCDLEQYSEKPHIHIRPVDRV